MTDLPGLLERVKKCEDGPWRELVEPIAARCDLAAMFPHTNATFNGDGAKALAELLRRMADKLDHALADRCGLIANPDLARVKV